jgi:uncharacterized protein involved in exopolysaccharide biosynthesis
VKVLVDTLRQGKVLILIMAAACALIGGVWQIVAGRQYKATVLMQVVPLNRGGSGSVSELAGQLTPFASLAGIGAIGAAQRPEALAVLQSRALTEKYLSDNDLLPVLYPGRWDAEQKRWKNVFFLETPTLWDANEKFGRIRRISQDSKTGLVTLTITWRDPKLAAQWANDLVALTNQRLRDREMSEARRNVTYLTEQVSKTSLMEVRNALSSLIEGEVKREMLANGTDEFALRVIDPAVPPGRPSAPGFILSVLLGAVAGVFVSAFFLFRRASLRSESSADRLVARIDRAPQK